MFNVIAILLDARQSTTCLSPVISTLVQPVSLAVAVDKDAVGVSIVKVAAAGMINKAWARLSTQNWQIRETVKPVIGIPGVKVVFGVEVVVSVGLTATVGVSVAAGVEVACAVAVGEPC